MYILITERGFEVLDENNRLIELHKSYEGILKNTRVFDDQSNLEEAIDCMFQNEHRLAIFGVNRKFMYTKKNRE